MRRRCWCGCGRVLGGREGRIAEQASEVEALVNALRERHQSVLAASGTDPSEFEGFIEYGEQCVGELLMVAHGELPASALDRLRLKRWDRAAVKALRRSGPTGYEVVQELRNSQSE